MKRGSTRPKLLSTARAVALATALLGALPSAALECPVPAEEAIPLARAAGFSFERSVEGPGSCLLIDENVVVSAAGTAAIRCEIAFFGSAALANDWKLVRAAFTGGQLLWVSKPDPDAAAPRFVVALKAPRGETRQVRLSEIVLAGNDCAEWQRAFE